MAKSKVFNNETPAGEVSFNVVPLVDVAFLMILFFILTSQLASSAISPVELPSPTGSVAIEASKIKDAHKVIVNIVSAAEGKGLSDSARSEAAREYLVDGEPVRVGDRLRLTELFRDRLAAAQRAPAAAPKEGEQGLLMIVRGDWRVSYSDVEPVLTAAAQAGISRMNITTIMDK